MFLEQQAIHKVQKANSPSGSLCQIMSTFFSSKKSHEDTKDKEPVLDIKEEKLGMEGKYIPLCTLVDRSHG